MKWRFVGTASVVLAVLLFTGIVVLSRQGGAEPTPVAVRPTTKPARTGPPTPAPSPSPTPPPGKDGLGAKKKPKKPAPRTPAGRTQLAVFCGNSPAEVRQFEQWLGGPVDGVLGYTGDADWSDYDSSVGWAVDLWSALDRPVNWSVPLIPHGASLAAAAAGDYNGHYRKAAATLLTFRPGDKGPVNVRTGWEFNGDWFQWAAKGRESEFKGAFRQFVNSFRAVAREAGKPDRFRFEWNVNVGDMGMDPTTAYPGDDVVDVIGMDFYWNTQWDGDDPAKAWESIRTRPWGLEWHQRFAKQRGKPTSYSEWGVKSDRGAEFFRLAKAWFDKHRVLFHTYWNSNSDFPGKLSDGQYPNAGKGYRAAFRGAA